MTILLRDYQNEMIKGTRAALKTSRCVLIQAPTGAGKTVLAAFMIGQTAARNEAAWFICHRAELVEGTSNTLRKYGLQHGFIAAGLPLNLRAMIQVCSIDTLKGRLATLKAPRLAVIDEAHHGGAAGWALVIAWLRENGTIVVGLSATPQRLDGRGLDDHFEVLVPGPQTAWLINNGHLSPYEAFIPDAPDMKGVRKQMGDYKKAEAAEKMDKPKLTGNIIRHWRKNAEGLCTIGFGVNVAHSQHLAESFNQAGIPAAHLDGGTPKAERREIIRQFADDELKVLFNVSLFGEGFDLAAVAQKDVTIGALIDASPTQSLAAVMQRWGRTLRPAPGKTAIINDHAGNMLRHGFPDDEREWSLAGQEKGTAANDNGPPPPVICGGCFNAIRRPLPPKCPHCQKSMQPEQKEIEVAEGELKAASERDKETIRQRLKREEAAAKDVGALASIFAKRGVPNPMGRAVVEFAGRRYKR